MADPHTHRRKGDDGEAVAKKILEQKGYAILDQNFTVPGGEIDIIACDPQTHETVFVEVKTRYGTSQFGSIYESIGKKKLQYMQRAMEQFFYRRGENIYTEKMRMDVIFIHAKYSGSMEGEHIKNAFSFDDFFDTL